MTIRTRRIRSSTRTISAADAPDFRLDERADARDEERHGARHQQGQREVDGVLDEREAAADPGSQRPGRFLDRVVPLSGSRLVIEVSPQHHPEIRELERGDLRRLLVDRAAPWPPSVFSK